MHNKTRHLVNAIAIFVLLAAIIGVPTKFAQAEALSRPYFADGDYLWAKGWGATSDNKSSIAVDSNGNVYTTGRFIDTVDFDPSGGTFNITSVGLDIYISKLDTNGNLIWVKSMGGSGLNAPYTTNTSNDIAIDTDGNIYITGDFCGTTDFDPGPGVTALTSSGSCDLYVAELDSNGNFVKARGMGGIYSGAEGYGIAVDAAGNIYTTGHFTGTVDFDPSAGKANLTSMNQKWYIFVSKLDANGNYVLAKAMGGTNGDAQGLSIVVDSAGNMYTVGNYTFDVDFDPGPGVFSLMDCAYPGLISCGFLSKLDGSGNFVLAKQMDQSANDIALDSGGNILAAGSIVHSSYLPHGPSMGGTLIDYIVIYKLDSASNTIWRNEMGTMPGYSSAGSGIAVDVSDNVYVTGDFSGTVDFDPGPGVFNLTSSGVDMLPDIFISKWDSHGNLVLAKAMGGASFDSGKKIAVDSQGNMYTTGFFKGTVDFDPGPGTTNLTSTNEYDIFVSKLEGDIIPPIFADVPFSYWANSYIERLYNAGVTGGCSTNPVMYCPESFVNRAQMAVFLLRGIHGAAYTPPVATGTMFGDVPSDYWVADWIEQLFNEGITAGCSNGNYCPEVTVTRDQIAVFLLRAEHGASYTPPPATGVFTDVPTTHWAAPWIEQLATEGITGGCGVDIYCPSTPVTRAQMAVFLVKAFSLP